ncbi:MAG: hypothetical protein JWM91_1111 [Rhodospirillales bacterium]|nr:hypothetical protein [Rhodospirillales bacterium]
MITSLPTFEIDMTILLEELDPDQRVRADRFRFRGDRDVYILAHALLSAAVVAAIRVNRSAWRFNEQDSGKPRLEIVDGKLLYGIFRTRAAGLR